MNMNRLGALFVILIASAALARTPNSGAPSLTPKPTVEALSADDRSQDNEDLRQIPYGSKVVIPIHETVYAFSTDFVAGGRYRNIFSESGNNISCTVHFDSYGETQVFNGLLTLELGTRTTSTVYRQGPERTVVDFDLNKATLNGNDISINTLSCFPGGVQNTIGDLRAAVTGRGGQLLVSPPVYR